MAKPSSSTRWANLGSNNVDPPSGLRDSGYATNAIPASGHVNELLKANHEWKTWLEAEVDKLSGPILTFGAASFFNGPFGTTPWEEKTAQKILHGAASVAEFVVPIVVPIGSLITMVRVRLLQDTATAGGVTARLLEYDGAGGTTNRSDETSSAASTSDQTMTLTNVNTGNIAVLANHHWFVRVRTNASLLIREVSSVEVGYTVPPS